MRIAFVFPGYGSQFVTMAKELYDGNRIVQEYFEEASICMNSNFVKLCFASSDADLAKITNSYPAIFLVSGAISRLLKQEGIEPSVVVGYNNGSYAALFYAGAFSFPDGIYLLAKYAALYQEAIVKIPVSLIRIQGLGTQKLEEWCAEENEDDRPYIAIYHDATTHIVGGSAAALERLVKKSFDSGQKISIDPESSDVGLHSPLLQPIADQFKTYLEKVDCRDIGIPFMSGINAQRLMTGAAIKEYLVEMIINPVRWSWVMQTLAIYDIIIEIGPGTTLSSMMKRYYPEKLIRSINRRADIEELKNMIKA